MKDITNICKKCNENCLGDVVSAKIEDGLVDIMIEYIQSTETVQMYDNHSIVTIETHRMVKTCGLYSFDHCNYSFDIDMIKEYA